MSNIIQSIFTWIVLSPFGQFVNAENLLLLAPEFLLLVVISVGLFQTMSPTIKDQQETWKLAILGTFLALCSLLSIFFMMDPADGVSYLFMDNATLLPSSFSLPVLYDMFRADLFSVTIRFFLLLGTLLVLLFSRRYMETRSSVPGEFYILMLGATLGAMLMAGANDLIMLFVALETLGISSFVLAGYLRGNEKSTEAALKYLIFGGTATAVLLFGFSLLYGLSGAQTGFQEIALGLRQAGDSGLNFAVVSLMLIMILGGFAFKLSAAPFHMWTPDIYEGAPTPVTAFLSVVSKVGAFAMVIRFLFVVLHVAPAQEVLAPFYMIFGLFAILSMTLGNVVALKQTSIKRMLAYSTIAHVGYLFLGFLVMGVDSIASILFYLMTYVFMNLGAFAVAIQFSNETERDDIQAYAGLVQKKPFLAFYMTFFLLSLAGIPITAGFFAKFFLFQTVAAAGQEYLWFVIVALLNSTISLYYYINVIRLMLVSEPSDTVKAMSRRVEMASAFPVTLALIICFLGTLLLGIYADPLMALSRDAVSQLRPTDLQFISHSK